MSKYAVPVVFSLVGWVEIAADSLEEAKKKVQQINNGDLELNIMDINESDSSVECMEDEIELLRE